MIFLARFSRTFYFVSSSTCLEFCLRYRLVMRVRKYAYAYSVWFIHHAILSHFHFVWTCACVRACECLFRWSCQLNKRKKNWASNKLVIVGKCWNSIRCHWSLSYGKHSVGVVEMSTHIHEMHFSIPNSLTYSVSIRMENGWCYSVRLWFQFLAHAICIITIS